MATINAWNSNLPAEVAKGGTGNSTLTNHGLLVGAGTAAITQLADATNGQIPIGSTGADPVLSTLTAGTGITITNGAGSITIAANGSTVLETLTGNSGGAVSPTSGNINIVGDGTTVNVVGNPGTHTLTISAVGTGTVETLTGDSGGAISPTAGNINIQVGTARGTSHFAGSGSTLNLVYEDGSHNLGFGALSLNALSGGSSNIAMGVNSGQAITSGQGNAALGVNTIGSVNTGSYNVALGNSVGGTMTTGSYNILLGRNAGSSYTSSESYNIAINAASTTVAAESNVLRIGDGTGTGTQQLNAAYISGITGVNVGSTASVVTMGTGGTANKLGTATITAGSGISVTPGANTITIANTASSSITITGDSGGGLTGTSFTFTGGTTGLTFAGAGTTETLGGTLAIANGGTNATSMSTSTGIVKYDGTRLVTSTTAKIDSSNRQTNTSQPAFAVRLNSAVTNVTGDGTTYSVLYDTTEFDQNSNITLNSSGNTIFTAPVTGRYWFKCSAFFTGLTVADTDGRVNIQVAGTSANTIVGNRWNVGVIQVSGFVCMDATGFVTMTAGDTAFAQVLVSGSTKSVGLLGDPSLANSFQGYLVC